MGILRDTTINGTLIVNKDILAGGGLSVADTALFNHTIFNNIPTFKQGLGWYGWSPITTSYDDTVENWTKVGTNFCYFTASSMALKYRPEYYGCIFNIVMGDPDTSSVADVHQLWLGLNGLYRRTGNASGWIGDGKWKKVTETLLE